MLKVIDLVNSLSWTYTFILCCTGVCNVDGRLPVVVAYEKFRVVVPVLELGKFDQRKFLLVARACPTASVLIMLPMPKFSIENN